ncbi:MAG: ABC transporter ATP-binding protein [Chloroflexota bacterium]
MANLVLRDIWKSFDGEPALQGISFECRDGEMFCLLGPSGAGKTSTIRVIAGLEQPNKGEIFLDGQAITHMFPQKRNMATAFESYALYPHLTVFDNIAFPLRAPIRAGEFSAAGLDSRVKEVAAMLNIGELLGRYPKELSGGQRQRVALGRALVRRPKVYLLDEPIAHLDAKLRHRMRGELRKIQTELGITTIYATPDQLEALSMADTVAVINKGKLEQIGAPDEIYNSPANVFVGQFVGDPPMNILTCRIRANAVVVVETETAFVIPLLPAAQSLLANKVNQEEVKVGIRPKDIELMAESAGDFHIRGQVKEIDTLGQTTVATVGIGSTEIKVKVATRAAPARHSNVGLRFDNSRFHYFEAATERRIE